MAGSIPDLFDHLSDASAGAGIRGARAAGRGFKRGGGNG